MWQKLWSTRPDFSLLSESPVTNTTNTTAVYWIWKYYKSHFTNCNQTVLHTFLTEINRTNSVTVWQTAEYVSVSEGLCFKIKLVTLILVHPFVIFLRKTYTDKSWTQSLPINIQIFSVILMIWIDMGHLKSIVIMNKYVLDVCRLYISNV